MKNIGIDVYIAVSCNFECSVTELDVKFMGRWVVRYKHYCMYTL